MATTPSAITGRASGRRSIRASTPKPSPRPPDGRTVVTVHQVVRDKDGNVLNDRRVEHVYRFRDGLVDHMEIRER